MTTTSKAQALEAGRRRSRTVGFLLEPLDVLFFRDGRPFDPATRGESRPLPFPQTLAGAIWTALLDEAGCDFAALGRRMGRDRETFAEALAGMGLPAWIAQVGVRGPWFARLDGPPRAACDPEVLVPAPAVLHRIKGESAPSALQLRPLPTRYRLPGWNHNQLATELRLRPLWLFESKPTEPATGFLTPDGLAALLEGRAVAAACLVAGEQLFDFDHRTGIGIRHERLTAEESLIYTVSFLSLRRSLSRGPEVMLYGEAVLPAQAPPDAFGRVDVLRLGGEGRLAAVHRLEKPFAWPSVVPSAGQGLMVVLTTPGIFARRWVPAVLAEQVVAAAVPAGVATGGWDLARQGPKPTRFAAPAGSVYFAHGPVERLPDTLADEPADQQQGWGCYVTGIWRDE